MIIHRIVYSVISIFIICLCLITFFEKIANANETKVLTAEEIKKGAVDYLAKTLPWDRESVEITAYYEGGDITIPNGKVDLTYKKFGGNKTAGRLPLTLLIKTDKNYKKRIRINSRVLVSQEVIKTTHTVKRGEILSKDNIQLETIQTERPWKNAMDSLEHALGYEASRNLPSGKILTQKIIKKPALGSKGDKILILAEKGGMTITAPGILKEDGYEDGMVKVLNMESKKTIYGRLVDANTVKVSF